ncbi:MarR family winged helix-turn-helix transcriptional regulator [Winogradskyella sp.]|jgi:DNA-binding MarR family transcriptional regulator|uniref:MarR family winged helix-turn-helix transcriptional regulator n=1 Tax=Winogradskyella sp. TaxID=1883156 RepID=UPI0025F00708|nr:MarR family transcriptional regulator [Winogradskyella sp.]MCT4630647.1 MarR family transcriptional regulator [Winogradskyella sp.]
MKSNDIDFENSLAPWMGKTVKITEYYLHKGFKENGLDLTKEQMIVLKKLHDNDGINQNELAFLVLRDKSSLARLLSKMEKKGYIKRLQCENDKRCNNVFLTNIGKEMFSKCKPIIKELIQILEKGITKEEKKIVINILKKAQNNFGEQSEKL